MARLAGKVAFITGGGGGIGGATAERFAEEGARVDVTDRQSVEAAIAETVARYGKLDVLHNNAGGSTLQDGPVTEAPEEKAEITTGQILSVDSGVMIC